MAYHTPILLPRAYFPVEPGIVFDNAAVSPYEAALSTYTFSAKVGTSGVNRCMVIPIAVFASGTVTRVRVAGVDATFLREDHNGVYRSEVWYLVAPATGTPTVQIDLSTSLTSIAAALNYTGVDQSSPIDAHGGANGTNNPASGSVTTIQVKDRVVAALAAQTASGILSSGGQAPRSINNGALGTGASADKGLIDVPASTTLTFTGLGALDVWAVSLVALKPVQGVLWWQGVYPSTRPPLQNVVTGGMTPACFKQPDQLVG